MRLEFHPPSAVLGALVLAGAFALVSLAAPQAAGPKWEFKIVTDPDQDDVRQLGKDGWQYAGYLGRNVRGSSVDDGLWQKAK